MIINIFGVHLAGVSGFLVGELAVVGALSMLFGAASWVDDRFEWDRPSWRPWTWRLFRRWFAPGQVVETEDYETACVLDVDFGAERTPLDTWVRVQSYREDADEADLPVWLPLADVMPAAVGPFADDDPTDRERGDTALTA